MVDDDTERERPRKKPAPRRSDSGESRSSSTSSSKPSKPRTQGEQTKRRPTRSSRPKPKAADVIVSVREEFAELTGCEIESVVSVERTDDGWNVGIEVIETRRIPDTTDVLAVYEVTTDDSGSLASYHRRERYVRGNPAGGAY